MKKILINPNYCGLSLKPVFHQLLYKYKGIMTDIVEIPEYDMKFIVKRGDPKELSYFINDDDIQRDDPQLLEMFGIYGSDISDFQLKLVYIPDEVEWEVVSNDHWEWIQEKHRTWS